METLIVILVIVAVVATVVIVKKRQQEKLPKAKLPKKPPPTPEWKIYLETIRTAMRGMKVQESRKLFLKQNKEKIDTFKKESPEFREELKKILEPYNLWKSTSSSSRKKS